MTVLPSNSFAHVAFETVSRPPFPTHQCLGWRGGGGVWVGMAVAAMPRTAANQRLTDGLHRVSLFNQKLRPGDVDVHPQGLLLLAQGVGSPGVLTGNRKGCVSERGRALSHRPPGACEPTWFVT